MDELAKKASPLEEVINSPVVLNKTEQELASLVAEYKDIKIESIKDKGGYELAKKARKHLVSTRTDISNYRLSMTAGIRDFMKKLIVEQNRLIAIIEPLEKKLDAQIKAIDEEKDRLKRLALLPQRQEELQKIEINLTDDEILAMNEKVYQEFFNKAIMEFNIKLQNRQREIEEKAIEEKVSARRKALHMAGVYLDDTSVKNLSDNDFDAFILNAIEERKAKEAQDLRDRELAIEAKLKKEQEEREEKARLAEAKRIKEEKEAQEKIEKDKAYLRFKEMYKDQISDTENYKLVQEGNTVILYQIIAKIEV